MAFYVVAQIQRQQKHNIRLRGTVSGEAATTRNKETGYQLIQFFNVIMCVRESMTVTRVKCQSRWPEVNVTMISDTIFAKSFGKLLAKTYVNIF
jgi:hypothetical protein